MRRRILCWEVAFCLMWLCSAPAFAVESSQEESAPPLESAEESLPEEEPFPFGDVEKDSAFFNAIKWAVEAGITKGTSNTTFSPDNTCTQKQILIMIWRAVGEPGNPNKPNAAPVTCAFIYTNRPEGAGNDEDEPKTEIGMALHWAYSKGLELGEKVDAVKRHFDETAACTRVDAMRFIWALLSGKAPCDGETALKFEDVTPFHPDYAAVMWAVSKGITNGTSDTTFAPDRACMRKHIAKFLYQAYLCGYLDQ